MSLRDYHLSITDELNAVSKRVRSLVRHWGEDGRHHEVVLKNVIMKFLPERYSIGTGFVIKPTKNRGKHTSSKQIDLIIYDTNFPTFFKEGDFVILTPDAVKGIIQVKANLQNQNNIETYNNSNENGKFIWEGKSDKTGSMFNGIFSFDGFEPVTPNLNVFEQRVRESYQTHLTEEQRNGVNINSKDTAYLINHIAINKDHFIKHWNSEFNNGNHECYSRYRLRDLSFSFFISNLMNYITDNDTIEHDNFLWFVANKENRKIKDF